MEVEKFANDFYMCYFLVKQAKYSLKKANFAQKTDRLQRYSNRDECHLICHMRSVQPNQFDGQQVVILLLTYAMRNVQCQACVDIASTDRSLTNDYHPFWSSSDKMSTIENTRYQISESVKDTYYNLSSLSNLLRNQIVE
ncbi:hypothetical protein LOAG_04400 [Loa loa]|uniref:Uncharacterized protein n=1 Tax=Loa loa TaxID=7209 RepID=A0A1S0U280_LOALO|nr:hypothetical protein LOAG_04400 [Loa loa]EFO24084.1 hypothetical protein LOAG_04400 [Loa loa]